MYGKHFQSMYTGSMIGAGLNVYATWGYVIANTVKGCVELNPRLLSMIFGCQEAEVAAAIEYLQAPDPHSRCKEHEGRRLIREGEYQYFVPSHEAYNKLRSEEERREYMREYMRQKRSSQKLCKQVVNSVLIDVADDSVSCNVSNVSQPLAMLAHTEADTEADTEAVRTSKKTPLAPSDFQSSSLVPPELEGLELYKADKKLCKAWPSFLEAARVAYPAVDVLAEVRIAHAWEVANPKKRKKQRTRFLHSWLSRAQDKPSPEKERKFVD